MANQIKNWLSERFPFTFESFKSFGSEPVPHHLKHWWWALGGTPAYFFILQIVTGILLTFYYVPAIDHAYSSVKEITDNVAYGWYIRSMHKWSANFMIISVILHMIRVFITGSYRKPRELNWMVGVMMLALTLLLGFTGYSLVFEQLSYWGITVVGNLLEAIPLIGDGIANFFRGGETISQTTLSRVFILHAAILPGAIIVLIMIHVAFMHKLGITNFEMKGDKEKKSFPFFPDHLLSEIIIALVLMFLLTILSVIFPAGLGPEANPQVTPAHIKPEWYFFWAFRLLKITSLTFSVLSVGAAFFITLMWPFIDTFFRKKKPNGELSMLFGILGVFLLVGLTLWEAFALLLSH